MNREETPGTMYDDNRPLNIRMISETLSYARGLELQKELHAQVAEGKIPDQLLLLEHLPVYTMGKRGDNSDFLLHPDRLEERGIHIARTDRGGQITYHGPGQLVAYIISNMGDRARSIRKFVYLLEEVVIRYLAETWGIQSERHPEHPGVWCGDSKIAALGISIHDKTTMHGFALNISTDMSYFDAIVPCGIRDKGVCSVRQLLPDAQVPPPGRLSMEMEKIALLFRNLYGYGAG